MTGGHSKALYICMYIQCMSTWVHIQTSTCKCICIFFLYSQLATWGNAFTHSYVTILPDLQIFPKSYLPLNWENSDSLSSPFQPGWHLFLPWPAEGQHGSSTLWFLLEHKIARHFHLAVRGAISGNLAATLWGSSNWVPWKGHVLV